jgi:hypothetical protein
LLFPLPAVHIHLKASTSLPSHLAPIRQMFIGFRLRARDGAFIHAVFGALMGFLLHIWLSRRYVFPPNNASNESTSALSGRRHKSSEHYS